MIPELSRENAAETEVVPLLRWRDVLWLVHFYPLQWMTRASPASLLPLTERAADWGYGVARRRVGRAAAERMRTMLGISEPEAQALAKRYLWHAVQVTHIERRLRQSRPLPRMPLLMTGRDHLDAALARKKGVILCTLHRFAAGEVFLALRHAGYPSLVVLRDQPRPTFGRFGRQWAMKSQRLMIEYLYPERVEPDDPDLVLRILERLRGGGIVVIAADARRSSTAIDAPFLGGHVRLSTGLLNLAQLSGSPVVPCDPLYDSGGLRIEFSPALELRAGATREEYREANLPALVDVLERQLSARPDQWTHWVGL